MGHEQTYDLVFRVVVLGDTSVGKSSLVRSLTNNKMMQHYKDPSLGVELYTKVIMARENLCVKFQFWDSASQTKFRIPLQDQDDTLPCSQCECSEEAGSSNGQILPLHKCSTKNYLRNSVAVLILYDITERISFDNVIHWYDEVRHCTGYSNPVLHLVGCKSDLDAKRVVSFEEGRTFADDHNMEFYETSTVTEKNIESLFSQMIEDIYDRLKSGEIVFGHDCEGTRLNDFLRKLAPLHSSKWFTQSALCSKSSDDDQSEPKHTPSQDPDPTPSGSENISMKRCRRPTGPPIVRSPNIDIEPKNKPSLPIPPIDGKALGSESSKPESNSQSDQKDNDDQKTKPASG